jgi:uncharacterized protein (TIGR04255 family)
MAKMQQSESSVDLPKFSRPPVNEVALAVHFLPLEGLTHLDLGSLRETWRAKYPEVEEYPELPPVAPEVEGYDQALQFPIFGFDSRPRWPRSWFLNTDRDRLIQLQRDRLVVNWRRGADHEIPYPHYDEIKPAYSEALRQLSDFVVQSTGTTLAPVQYEVTYINQVKFRTSLAEVVSPWSGSYSTAFLPVAEDLRMQARYPIVDVDGRWRGRLYVSVNPTAGAADNGSAALLHVFARTLSQPGDAIADIALLDLAHEWVVKGFAAFTTKDAHMVWGEE